MSKQKLELTWVGKDVRPRLEPRVLLPDTGRSYTAAHRVTEADIFENKLIFGDNLLALKALEQELAGQVKCVFIDPPYNTGSAFEHYDDGLEHSLWLSMMRDRLELLRTMLSDDGSIWISLDDNEVHYLKVLMDEVFERQNFVANLIWEKSDSPRNSARQFSTDHDHVLIYSRKPSWVPNKLARTEEANSIYANPDDDPMGPWLPGDPFANKPYSKGRYEIVGPTGRSFSPPQGRYWRISEDKLRELDRDNRIWWGPTKSARPSIKRYLSEVGDLVPRTFWKKEDAGSNRTAKNEMRELFRDDPFDTPKPEKLIKRVLEIATNPGDLVLDSFSGSGTTGAVAHKMGRRWVMVELQETAHTHIIPRLRKVIDGTDGGGITQSVGWTGGGGFQYFKLAPTLIVKDKRGQEIINPDFNAEMLAEALCKLQGFVYSPSSSAEEYWMHGRSTERDFLYVTTQHLTHMQLQILSDDVGDERSLLVMCSAFDADPNAFGNLTVKKIPQAILHKCEWGKDDYSLRVQNLPMMDPQTELSLEAATAFEAKSAKVKRAKDKDLTSLFADGEA